MLDLLNKALSILKALAPDPRILLLSAAKYNIGNSLCPNNIELGCVDSVNAVHKWAFGLPICDGSGTVGLYMALLNDHTFSQIQNPMPGDVIISVTSGVTHGHVGIFLDNGTIASNDSDTGRFLTKYDILSWRSRYVASMGLKTAYFRKILKA